MSYTVRRGGIYEVPANHKWREDCRFIWVSRLMGNQCEVRLLIGTGDIDIQSARTCDVLPIVEFSDSKHQVSSLVMKMNRKTGAYVIRAEYNGAVLENSAEVTDGIVVWDRSIPAAPTLKSQASLDYRTQGSPGIYGCTEIEDMERMREYHGR